MDYEYSDAQGNRKKASFNNEAEANNFARDNGFDLIPVSSSSSDEGPAPADSVAVQKGLPSGTGALDDSKAIKRYPTLGNSGAAGTEQYTNEIATWKNNAVKILRGLYKGDFDAFMVGVLDPKKKPILDDGGNKQQLYNAVKAVLTIDPSQPAQLQAIYDLEGNKYLDIVKTNSELSAFHRVPQQKLMPGLDAAKTGNAGAVAQGMAAAKDLSGVPGRVASNVGTTAGRVLMPNLTLRSETGEGTFSRGVGALSDVLGFLPRVGTATVEGLLPTSTGTTWLERVGRPDPFSTTAERAVDFTASGAFPGRIIANTVAKGAAGLSRYQRTPQIIKDITRGEDAQSAVLGPYLKGADIHRSYASRALAGAGEGAAYSTVPALTVATNPEQTNPDRGVEALTTLGAGTGFGAGAGVAGKFIANKLRPKDPEHLSNWGQELLGGYGSLSRLGKAANNPREPLTSSIQGVEQIAGIKSSLSSLLESLGKERQDILAGSISPVVNPLTDFGTLASKSVSPKQQRYIDAILTKLTRDYAEDHRNPTLEELMHMRTAAGKIVANTKGTEEAIPAAKVFGYIKDQMDKVAGKTRALQEIPEGGVMTAEQKASAEAFYQEQLNAAYDNMKHDESMWVDARGNKFDPKTAPKGRLGYPINEMDADFAEEQMKQSLASLAKAVKAPKIPVSSVSIQPALQKNYEKFAQVLGELEGWSLSGENVESALSKVAQSRLDPLTRGASFKSAAESMDAILKMMNAYKVPKFDGKGKTVSGEWEMSDIDYLTPAVIREVRKRIKGDDSSTFRMLTRRLINAVAPTASTSTLGALGGAAVGATTKGAWVGPHFTTENSRPTVDPVNVSLDTLAQVKK